MKEISGIILALFAGAVLGIAFFGGLWWTIQRGVSSASPAILFSGSLLLRTATTVAGFYWVAQGNWRNLLPCLLGFVLARLLLTRYVRTPMKARTRMLEEGGR